MFFSQLLCSYADYKIIKKIGEGTFSEVVKAQSLKDGKYYACKTMKQSLSSLEQANNLREVQAMKKLNPHPNIIQLHELIFDKESGTLSLVCELMEMNIYEYIRGRQQPLPESKIRHYMYQLCKSLDHMHSNGIFHRDVKPENILIKHDVLKLGDFGSCRSLHSKPPYTEYISTRWYRAPECLLTDGYYSHKMDMWSVGCVFYEIISLSPLFPGTNELDQVTKIHDVLGTPDSSLLQKFRQSRAISFDFPPRKGSGISRLIPNCSAPSLSLLYQMLAYDPEERIGSRAALQHHNIKHVAEPRIRRNIQHYPVELPKLNVVVPAPQITYPVATVPALTITHCGSPLPVITSKKCHLRLAKVNTLHYDVHFTTSLRLLPILRHP
uniref:Protein kinase domain-containing protein n=1 Tax=Oncorhynchus tshawytscha TaxID=74940 RepID=A0A8C8EM80_ONCTS